MNSPKTCSKCGGPLHIKNTSGICTRTRRCKRANRKASVRAHNLRQKAKPGHKEQIRAHNLKLNYNLTPAQVDAMLAAQDGRCAICGTTEPGRKGAKERNWHIDHCHSTGTVRGILCVSCNMGIGAFKDNVFALVSAAVYLGDSPPATFFGWQERHAWHFAPPDGAWHPEDLARHQVGKSKSHGMFLKYGLRPGGYLALLDTQEGGCAICRRTTSGYKGREGLFVDHEHGSAQVRGLLCKPCNQGVGLFKDTPALLWKAVEYLEKFLPEKLRERAIAYGKVAKRVQLPDHHHASEIPSGDMSGLVNETESAEDGLAVQEEDTLRRSALKRAIKSLLAGIPDASSEDRYDRRALCRTLLFQRVLAESPKTLDEVARRFDLSRQAVRNIELEMLKRLGAKVIGLMPLDILPQV